MKYLIREKILVIHRVDLINFTDDPIADCAFSIYKNVYVVWDGYYDLRVKDVIDYMPDIVQEELVAIYEHRGNLNLLWLTCVPPRYKKGILLNIPGDLEKWLIVKSMTVSQLPYYERKTKVITENILSDLIDGVDK
jgi:hypothetical protein